MIWISDCQKRIIVRTIVTVILVFLILLVVCPPFIYVNNKPEKVFEKTYHFALPESAEILQFQHKINDYHIRIKFRIDERDYRLLKEDLLGFHGEGGELTKDEYASTIHPNWKANTSWWDLNVDDAIFSCYSSECGKYLETISAFSFIVKDTDDTYLVYCSY